jgi:acyl carrier protein
MEEIYGKLADIMQVDQVKPSDILASFVEWDSLSVLSVVAMADADYALVLNAEELLGVSTAQELVELIAQKREKKGK